MNIVKSFLKDERGQDLVEYTLLTGFLALASAALFINAGGNVAGIWTSANNTLATAQGAGYVCSNSAGGTWISPTPC